MLISAECRWRVWLSTLRAELDATHINADLQLFFNSRRLRLKLNFHAGSYL